MSREYGRFRVWWDAAGWTEDEEGGEYEALDAGDAVSDYCDQLEYDGDFADGHPQGEAFKVRDLSTGEVTTFEVDTEYSPSFCVSPQRLRNCLDCDARMPRSVSNPCANLVGHPPPGPAGERIRYRADTIREWRGTHSLPMDDKASDVALATARNCPAWEPKAVKEE